ncbi:hypothetical protein TNIN_271011 [Trichonephila inaurata madagascariensis]|uniref:Uncharacterized protein n=1 Tax=Trichonephila inaurata madagascariensis TaxID=2747483 RepID=A0A8X7BP45_9ARAC|nr:hypothetical protein TNIN_271011 [Trichonephila inaurata madagascariensis]
MKLLLFLVLIFTLTSLFCGFEYPKMKGDLFGKLFQSYLSPSSSDDETGRRRREDVSYIFGRSSAFCNMFGCEDCAKGKDDMCCKGYLYDQRSKECRHVLY